MLKFILKRLILIIPMALIVVTLTWGLIRVAPGTFYDSEKPLPPAIKANIEKKYGLDKPWYQQYWIMLTNVIQGDFGDSLRYQGQSVNEIIRRHLPYSATIGILAYLLAVVIGLGLGIVAALKTEFVYRLRRDDCCNVRAIRTEFRFRPDTCFDLCPRMVHFSARALGWSFKLGFTGVDPFCDLRCIYYAAYTSWHARGDAVPITSALHERKA
jgi:hypothetical protein